MVEAADELRERLRVVLAENGVDEAPATLHSWRCEYPERYGKCDCIAELVTDLVAVVAEACTEGAIAELEAAADLILAPSEHLRDSATCRDIAYDLHERAAALRGVGNQNAEPRWSANRLEEVLREGLPDQNAEPLDLDVCECGKHSLTVMDHAAWLQFAAWADQKGTEQ